jgi:hypothetical protein
MEQRNLCSHGDFPKGNIGIYNAVSNGCKQCIIKYIDYVNTFYSIRIAIRNDDCETMEFLLKNGADPNSSNYLIDAVMSKNVKILDILLNNGTDPNSELFYSVISDNALGVAIELYLETRDEVFIEMIKILISHGISLDDLDDLFSVVHTEEKELKGRIDDIIAFYNGNLIKCPDHCIS